MAVADLARDSCVLRRTSTQVVHEMDILVLSIGVHSRPFDGFEDDSTYEAQSRMNVFPKINIKPSYNAWHFL